MFEPRIQIVLTRELNRMVMGEKPKTGNLGNSKPMPGTLAKPIETPPPHTFPRIYDKRILKLQSSNPLSDF